LLVIKDGPPEYQELVRELKSMNIALQSIHNNTKDPNPLLNRKGARRAEDLLVIVQNCKEVVKEVQVIADSHSSLQGHGGRVRRVWDAYQIGSADLDTFRGQLTFHMSTINMVLHSLEGPALGRIEAKIDLLVSQFANMSLRQARKGVAYIAYIASIASTASILSIFDPDQEKVA
jgi:hypothetical protein